MKVFVTGSEGFIGKHLCQFLLAKGHDVGSLESDLLDSSGLKSQLMNRNWDAVIHLAALSAYNACESDPAKTFSVNVGGTAHLLEMQQRFCPNSHFVFASTAQVYRATGMGSSLVFSESSDTAPKSIYGRSKLLAEECIRTFHRNFGGKYTILRLFNHSHKSQSPEFFLPHIFNSIQNTGERNVAIPVGNVDVSRDIGAVGDLIRAFDGVIELGRVSSNGYLGLFNVCSGKARNLRMVVETLASRLGKKVEFQIEESRYRQEELKSMCGDYSKLTESTGWEPSFQSDDEFIESFLADLSY